MPGREGEPVAVAVEHLDPGEQVVPERHRLGTLEVRVAGHDRLGVLLGTVEHRTRERLDAFLRLRAGVEGPEPESGDDLVVAGAAGVDLPPDRAEQPLDRGVHVLVRVEQEGAALARDSRQPSADLGVLLGGQETRGEEPVGVDPRPLAVVGKELRVVGLDQLPDLGGEVTLDASLPEGQTRTARARAAASSGSSDASRMNPSAASCGKVSPVAYDASVSA